MALQPSIQEREFNKFVKTSDGHAVRVSNSGGVASSNISSALADNLVVVGSACYPTNFICSNGSTAQWVMVFDAAAKPIDTTVPDFPPFYMQANETIVVDLPKQSFSTGFTIVNSSTQSSLTNGADDCFFMGLYTT